MQDGPPRLPELAGAFLTGIIHHYKINSSMNLNYVGPKEGSEEDDDQEAEAEGTKAGNGEGNQDKGNGDLAE